MKDSYKNETKMEQDFCKILTKFGWLALKLEGPRGWPDRTVLSPDGNQFYFEFKNPNGKGRLSASQIYWGDKLQNMHHCYYVVDNVADANTILFQLLGADYVNYKMGTS